MRRPCAFGCLLFLAFVAALPARAAQRVAPRFGWPAGARADVEVHLTGERKGPQAEWDLRSSFAITVQARGEDLHVVRTTLAPWRGSGRGPVIDRIVDLVPVLRVSGAGEFLGIEGADVAAQQARKVLGEDLPESAIAPLTSAAGLAAAQQDLWNLLVRVWLGFAPAEGEPVLLTHTTRVPQLGGGELKLHLEMRRVEPVACDGSDTQQRCVEFRLVSRPDKQMVESLLGGVGVPLSAYDMSQEVRIVTDAVTLLPRTARFWRWIEFAAPGPDGRSVVQSEEAARTYTFRWTLPTL